MLDSLIDDLMDKVKSMRDVLVNASNNPYEAPEIKERMNLHRAGEVAGYDRVLALLEAKKKEYKND